MITKIFTLVKSVAQVTFMKPDTRQLWGKSGEIIVGYHCAADFIPWELLFFVRRAVSDFAVSCFTACKTVHVIILSVQKNQHLQFFPVQ